MFAFPSLGTIYSTIAARIPCTVCFDRPVALVRRHGDKVTLRDTTGAEETFDHIIFATDAETALRSLERPSFAERWVLGRVRYFNDITVTHTDAAYMHKHYDVDEARGDQYYVRTHPQHPELIEMSFNLRNYQPQLRRDVYQTIFLDDTKKDTWTIDEIAPEKVLLRKWWRQFSHTWRHFAFTVPFVRFIQGKRNTWFCGGYTMFNTHEMAIMSGLAVAERLGAPYPFEEDVLAMKQFDQLLAVSHGTTRAKVRKQLAQRQRGATATHRKDAR